MTDAEVEGELGITVPNHYHTPGRSNVSLKEKETMSESKSHL